VVKPLEKEVEVAADEVEVTARPKDLNLRLEVPKDLILDQGLHPLITNPPL